MKYQQIKKMLLKRGIILAISATLLASTTNVVSFATGTTQTENSASDITTNTTTEATMTDETTGTTSTDTTTTTTPTTEATAPVTEVSGQAEYVKDENVYGKLATNGEVESLYVVNQFNVTKAGNIVDYGTYNRVENLTDLKEIVAENGSQTVAVEEGNFYYQGEIEKGALPWNIQVTYKLDGQEIKSEELAGKSGKLEIHLKTSKNEAVNSTFFDNYLMQISMTLSNQNCSDIVAEGGTMADAGENKQITFTVMPEKEGDLTLTSTVTNFEMTGISIAAVPFSMSVEFPDTSEMSDGLTDLSDGISSLNDGTQDLNSGAGQIKDGMVSLLDGMVEFHNGLTTYTNGVVSLNDGVQKVNSNIGKLTSGSDKLAEGSKSIAGGLGQMSEGGAAIVEGSKGIQGGLNNASSMLTAAGINATDVQNDATMQALYQAVMSGYITDAQYAAIATAVGTVGGLSNNYGSFETGLEQYAGGVSQLAEQYGSFNDGVSDFASGLSEFESGFNQLADGSQKLADGAPQLNDGSEQLVNGAAKFTSGLGDFRDGVQKLADGTDELADGTADMPEEMQEQMDEMMDDYKYDFEPVSFISDKNTNIEAVQFVLTTEEIKIQEPEPVKQEEKDKSFVERVQNLFSGLLDKKSEEE